MQRDAELEKSALTMPETARSIVVRDQQSYNLACSELLDIAAIRRKIVEHHADMKRKAHEAHRAICDAENALLKPVAEAESILKYSIAAYDREQRRVREEAERRAREEAERFAAEQREREIAEAEKDGATSEEVSAMCAMPLPPVSARGAVQSSVHKLVSGVSTAKTFRARVVDIKKLCAAVASGTHPHTLVLANEVALNSMARALKGVMDVPGVVVEEDTTVRAGRR